MGSKGEEGRDGDGNTDDGSRGHVRRMSIVKKKIIVSRGGEDGLCD